MAGVEALALLLWLQPHAVELARHYEAEYARMAASAGEDSLAAASAARDAGLFLLREGEAGRAVEWLQKARRRIAEEELREAYAQALCGARRAECGAELRGLADGAKDPARAARAFASLAEMAQDRKEAVGLWRQALAKQESVGRWNDLGLALQEMEDGAGALECFRKALATDKRGANPETAATWNNLASALMGTGKGEEALLAQRKALGMLQASLGPGHVRTALAESNLADILSALGRKVEARRLYARAYETFAAKLGAEHEWTREASAKRTEK